MSYLLQLPLPPSINDYYGHHCKFNYAKIYIKTKGKEYRNTVLNYVIRNQLQLKANIALTVNIFFTPSTNHKQDVDNVLKCLLDALTHAEVWEDDSLIYKLSIEKRPPSKTEAGIMMEIKAYE